MAHQRSRRRTAPKRTLIGPLVMLAGGMAVGVVVWRVLMLEPAPLGRSVPERLSHDDRHALDRLLSQHGMHP
jgi:hypothetical protein